MDPQMELDAHEARVFGVLVEKDLTTPDQYPQTLNSLTLGANQKSNRDPVLSLVESQVYAALQKLMRKGLVGSVHPVGSRVEKFRHNGEAALTLSTTELAVLAELLMRGPQQPGELRSRAARMTPIESLQALMDVLKPLLERGLVARLDPVPGSRAERYAQTLAPTAHPVEARQPVVKTAYPGEPAHAPPPLQHVDPPAEPGLEKRVAELEGLTSRLRRQLDNLAWKLGEKLEG